MPTRQRLKDRLTKWFTNSTTSLLVHNVKKLRESLSEPIQFRATIAHRIQFVFLRDTSESQVVLVIPDIFK